MFYFIIPQKKVKPNLVLSKGLKMHIFYKLQLFLTICAVLIPSITCSVFFLPSIFFGNSDNKTETNNEALIKTNTNIVETNEIAEKLLPIENVSIIGQENIPMGDANLDYYLSSDTSKNENIDHKTTAEIIESDLPEDIIKLAETFGLTKTNEIPKLSDLTNLLEFQTDNETVTFIRDLASTPAGLEMIQEYIQPYVNGTPEITSIKSGNIRIRSNSDQVPETESINNLSEIENLEFPHENDSLEVQDSNKIYPDSISRTFDVNATRFTGNIRYDQLLNNYRTDFGIIHQALQTSTIAPPVEQKEEQPSDLGYFQRLTGWASSFFYSKPEDPPKETIDEVNKIEMENEILLSNYLTESKNNNGNPQFGYFEDSNGKLHAIQGGYQFPIENMQQASSNDYSGKLPSNQFLQSQYNRRHDTEFPSIAENPLIQNLGLPPIPKLEEPKNETVEIKVLKVIDPKNEKIYIKDIVNELNDLKNDLQVTEGTTKLIESATTEKLEDQKISIITEKNLEIIENSTVSDNKIVENIPEIITTEIPLKTEETTIKPEQNDQPTTENKISMQIPIKLENKASAQNIDAKIPMIINKLSNLTQSYYKNNPINNLRLNSDDFDSKNYVEIDSISIAKIQNQFGDKFVTSKVKQINSDETKSARKEKKYLSLDGRIHRANPLEINIPKQLINIDED